MMFNSLVSIITKGHQRSVKAKKNIVASIIIKGIGILISLVMVPLTINYINPSQYGIWLTLSSMVAWFSFFDVGFGHGLRNKFAEAVASGQDEQARIYVSTTYAVLSIIIAIVLVFFLLVNQFLNWPEILNTDPRAYSELSTLAMIIFVFFCLQFIFQLISTVLTANQEPAISSLFNLIASLFSLGIIYILTKTTSGNLLYLGFALSITPVLTLATCSIWFYKHKYKKYSPSLKYVKFEYARSLISLGAKFFIIQIAAIVMFNTDNIIITQLFGPEKVTVFSVTFKLFSVTTMLFSIAAAPLWSAYTDAYTKNDFIWIKSTLTNMRKLFLVLTVFTLILLLCSRWLFDIWLGKSVRVPFLLSVTMASYVIGYMWQSIHVFFLNGISKIKLQLYLVTFSGIINIPLSILFGKYFGLVGIGLLSTLIFITLGTVFFIQTRKIINHTAKKIWNE